ncbi:hypothetical protein E4K64_39610 [Bradyrhizobium frederickii]|uniref:Uncharacterized protein n=1 Tax=Bradyrhizobium frederickii TaxID=2560054 RepID=A0A4Y9NFJ8_9BRAD|nr:hypothetical protein E4K66_40000 [Bradyrhizobium frederickii]TFV66147.1 hypothetical protein E4K64_39610 [Bradyrhizobium frederickii]
MRCRRRGWPTSWLPICPRSTFWWSATGVVDEAFAEVRASFDRFCLAAGIEALGTMMEADVTAACGPRHGRTSRCDISRHGVALLCGISPSLPAQGGQRRPPQKLNRTRDIPQIRLSAYWRTHPQSWLCPFAHQFLQS